jgi:hypothetical protein
MLRQTRARVKARTSGAGRIMEVFRHRMTTAQYASTWRPTVLRRVIMTLTRRGGSRFLLVSVALATGSDLSGL